MVVDKIIQYTIRTEFQDRTILTIAHRFDIVMNSNKILILDKKSRINQLKWKREQSTQERMMKKNRNNTNIYKA